MQKKPDFSIVQFVERPLNIFYQAKSFAKSILLPKETKFSGKTENAKMKVKLGLPQHIILFFITIIIITFSHLYKYRT